MPKIHIGADNDMRQGLAMMIAGLKMQAEGLSMLMEWIADDDSVKADTKEWLSTEEAMKMLCMNREQLARLRRSGKIKTYPISERLFVYGRESILKYLNAS